MLNWRLFIQHQISIFSRLQFYVYILSRIIIYKQYLWIAEWKSIMKHMHNMFFDYLAIIIKRHRARQS